MIIQIIKLCIYSILIVLISKYILVRVLRNIAKNLKLKPKTSGNIAGFATSIPELLTISFSAGTGFIDTAFFNVLSSNILNLIQYFFTVVINKNQRKLQNKAIKIDILLVIITILIPVLIIILNINNKFLYAYIPIFISLFFIINLVSKNAHELYIENEKSEKQYDFKESNINSFSKKIICVNVIILIISALVLYIIGELLGNTLEILCIVLSVPEFIIGILLGAITSIPEFITFFESQKHYRDKKSNDGVVEATSNLLFSNMINLFIIQTLGIIIFLIFS